MENVSVIEFYAIGRPLFKFDEVADFAERGKYAAQIRTLLANQPKKTIAKLREIGVDKESLMDLTRLLFEAGSIETYQLIINTIEDEFK